MLLDYARKANLDCNQADYQAYASCCWKEKEGIELIDEMRVGLAHFEDWNFFIHIRSLVAILHKWVNLLSCVELKQHLSGRNAILAAQLPDIVHKYIII